MPQTDPLVRLNINVLALLVELLNPLDIVRLRRVSKSWNEVLGSEHIARVGLLAHFPECRETQAVLEWNSRKNTQSRAKKEEDNGLEERPARRQRKKAKLVEEEAPTAVVGFRRATFRLHARLLAKPTRVHKYRLHHISEKTFSATSTHIFWAESSRKIWVQKIGEGVGGRRALKLKSYGERIAHVHQIVATEEGIVILLYRETVTWLLEMIAIEYETDKVVWKANQVAAPMCLHVADKCIYYTVALPVPNHNHLVLSMNIHIYIHSLATGRILHTAPLEATPWHGCPITPGAYIVYPPSNPTKIFASYDLRDQKGNSRYLIKVFDLKGNFLHKLEISRGTVEIGRYRPENSLRFIVSPPKKSGRKREKETLMVVETTSHPRLIPHKDGQSSESLNDPILSSWTINPETYEIEEVRRYHSSYSGNELVPSLVHSREGIYGSEHTRLECIDVARGISYIYYDEKPKGEIFDDEPIAGGVVRMWYETGRAKIDSIGYEEHFAWEKDRVLQSIQIKREQSTNSLLIATPPPATLAELNPFTHNNGSYYLPANSYPSPINSPSKDMSPSKGALSAKPQPIERHFIQTSRHRLVQPDIMRRRRRPNFGEDEEDWQLLQVRTGPVVLTDLKCAEGKSADGRFVCILAKCAGWSVTCFVLDFEPDW